MIGAGEALRRWMAGGSLTRTEMEALFALVMDGGLSEAMKAGLLVALAMKGESAEEIAGAAAVMRSRSVPIPHHREGVLDTCGTGGDGKGSFNISTAAALVAAAAGVPVAKHGNRSVSSRSGSADVLAALGVEIDVPPEAAARALDTLGIAFLFAPRFHPAMREVMGVRRELAVRTVFNLLGPLANPAGARRQVLGVYAPELVAVVARVLAELGSERALVVHGSDGLDEITLTGPTLAAEVRSGEVRRLEIEPQAVGLRPAPLAGLLGGTPEENAERLRRVLGAEAGPLREVTLLNGGAAIWIGGIASDLEEGVGRARSTIDSGAAADKLEALRAFGGGSERDAG